MKPEPIKISPAEWEIMEVLWGGSPLCAAEIFERLGAETSWNVKTVRSFLDRLVKKKAVEKGKAHGINVFKPIPRRERCLRQESRSFLDRFFQGSPVSMMSHFLEKENLSADEIDAMKRLLEGVSKVPQKGSRPRKK